MITKGVVHRITVLILFLILTEGSGAASKYERPLDENNQSALKNLSEEKDADAEVILWEVRVEKNGTKAKLSHKLRVKIINERGREEHSKIDLPVMKGIKIKDISGRTIKANGNIIELRPDGIFEREVIKAKKLKIKVISFVLPNVESGDEIEYSWHEERSRAHFLRFPLQRGIPVQTVRYYFKMSADYPYVTKLHTFNLQSPFYKDEEKGFRSLTLTNVPAFRAEPYMPPADAIRPWLLAYDTVPGFLLENSYWDVVGKYTHEDIKSRMKVNDDVRKATAEIVGQATTTEEKLRKIFDFCRSEIRNIYDEDLTGDELAEFEESRSPAETLRRRAGTGKDINMLFAALVNAAGFETRYVLVGDRSDTFFDQSLKVPYFLTAHDVAVRVENEWRFFDPGTSYVSYGMLRWQEEGQSALICDPNKSMFVKTPLTPPERSLIKRTGKLRLTEEGTLEGDIQVEYTGHPAAEYISDIAQLSDLEREEDLRDSLKQRINEAELTDIKFENISDTNKPLKLVYHIRVHKYAGRTGKRLFLNPAFFQQGLKPRFASVERKYPIYFSFPWSEEDTITIDLPPGYELDHANAPDGISAGATSQYKVGIGVTVDGKTLHYKRAFFFGGGGMIYFRTDAYAQLKQLFDEVNIRDNHTIVLKQGAVALK